MVAYVQWPTDASASVWPTNGDYSLDSASALVDKIIPRLGSASVKINVPSARPQRIYQGYNRRFIL